MAAPFNKKILVFIDEFGTAGKTELYLGAVFIPAAEAGRLDKIFSDLLPETSNELHAVNLSPYFVEAILARLHQLKPSENLLMLNRRATNKGGSASQIYADAVIELVKIGMRRYRTQVRSVQIKQPNGGLNNIELILDRNSQNTDPAFDGVIMQARQTGGQFRGVNHVACIDSAASRLLQLADLVASTRKWVSPVGTMPASVLHDRFGIIVL